MEIDPSRQELKNIIAPNDDFSFIYTVLQALFHLNTFKDFILKDKSKKEQEIKLGESLKGVFNECMNKDLIKSSKLIYYRIKKINNGNIQELPSKILIQILDILNKEQSRKENENINNENLISNLQNVLNSNTYNDEQKSFYEYLKLLASNNNNNKIGELFYIFFQKIINNFQMINNIIYEHEFFFELNLYEIFRKKSNNNTLIIKNNIPQLSLINCIKENSLPKNAIYNSNQCIEQKFLYSTSAYLIFILNRKGSPNNYYFGNFIYSNRIDLSSVILRKDNAKIYKLSSIIKEKKIVADINDNKENEDNYNFNYITINMDNNGEFYYYENNKKISKMFTHNKYFEHILIFKQERG